MENMKLSALLFCLLLGSSNDALSQGFFDKILTLPAADEGAVQSEKSVSEGSTDEQEANPFKALGELLGGNKTPSSSDDAGSPSSNGETHQRGCIPDMSGSGSGAGFNPVEMIKRKAIDTAINFALKQLLQLDQEVTIPRQIRDTCMADKYLEAAFDTADRLNENSDQMLSNIALSINEGDLKTEKAQKILTKYKDCNKSVSSKKNTCKISKEIKKALKNDVLDAQAYDKKLIFKAMSGFSRHTLRTAEYGGLVKEISNFSRNNMHWALMNSGKLVELLKGVKAPLDSTFFIGSFVRKMGASLTSKERSTLKASQDKGGDRSSVFDELDGLTEK